MKTAEQIAYKSAEEWAREVFDEAITAGSIWLNDKAAEIIQAAMNQAYDTAAELVLQECDCGELGCKPTATANAIKNLKSGGGNG